ncbi:hypothetical protein [Streptomyces silvisoli]|uniref:Secreted protein n=1 Tax=Streptomyces silvisoli TaxID=3034235 RepID=A0ABT5ZI60_9ACTN|nr:hypothetical protein [Streptomyces silvisoli]MDF3288713.1 hypothetical protein [Streptomyces silvisoli]
MGPLLAALLAQRTASARPYSPSWHLVFADAFNTPTRLGSFSDCGHNVDTPAAVPRGRCSAAAVPKRLMGLRYGKPEERFRVVGATSGYKSGHHCTTTGPAR